MEMEDRNSRLLLASLAVALKVCILNLGVGVWVCVGREGGKGQGGGCVSEKQIVCCRGSARRCR
jgi:hypothetical protein